VLIFSKNERVQKQKKIAALFHDREPLSPQSFYEKHYQNTGIPFEIVEKIKKILENVLEADLSCLYASDDFSENLSFFWAFDSIADVELILSLEEEFSIKITDSEAQQTHTIDDIIKLVVSKVKNA